MTSSTKFCFGPGTSSIRFVARRVKRRMPRVTRMATKMELVNQPSSGSEGAPIPPAASSGRKESKDAMRVGRAIVEIGGAGETHQ